MSTLITAAVLLALGLWALGVYGRLVRLRKQVTLRWRDVHGLRKRQQELTPTDGTQPPNPEDQAEAARAVQHAERIYNLVAEKYNTAVTSVPGNLLAGLAGFKRADVIEIKSSGGSGGLGPS